MSDINQPPQTIAQTIDWLHNCLGRPALPECPKECERDCNVPGGKAPAWINQKGKAVKVSWKPYQNQLPTQANLAKWFAHTTGIGTLGGGPNAHGHYIAFVDLDRKEKVFSSPQAFEARLEQWFNDYPLLNVAPRFRTPNGGYRVILAFTEELDWTAFSLDRDRARMGELLARNGGHTLLPPTVGANGIPYRWEYFVAYPPTVAKPEDVGIYPTRQQHPSIPANTSPRSVGSYVPGAIRLEDLLSPRAKEILTGGAKTGDRSDALTALASECYGWEEFCHRYSISYSGTTEILAEYAWGQMEDSSRDPYKWQRILKTISPSACQTAAEYHSGDSENCWKKIYRLDRETFQASCPPHIKDRILGEWGIDKRPRASLTASQQQLNSQKLQADDVASESIPPNNGQVTDNFYPPDSDSKQKENLLLKYIDQLLERGNIPLSERRSECAQIAQALELDPKYVEQIVLTRLQEWQFAEVESEKTLIEDLVSKRKQSLDLHQILPPEIACILAQIAAAMPTSAEHLMTVGWSTFGCAIGTAAEVVAWPGFKQKSCVLWTISTARSGKLKSQTQEVMVNPIRLLQQDANSEYCIALKSYKEAQKATQQNRAPDSPPEELPPPPVPREYWVEHITVEALIRTINENPRGFLVHRDEIDGFFKALNKYRAGKGDDEAFYLTLNNGGGPKVILIDRDRRVEVERSCVPITGTIQRKTLDEEMTPRKISSGWMARWVICLAQMPKRRRTRLPYPDIDAFLKDIYHKLSVLKMHYRPVQNEETGEVLKDETNRTVYQGFPITYHLSDSAADYYEQHFFNPMVEREEAELNEGFQLAMSKWSGYCLRIALILHCLHEICKLKNPDGTLKTYLQLKEEWKLSGGERSDKPFEIEIPTSIGADIIQKAIATSYFYINQAEVLYKGQQQDEDDTVPVIQKLIQKSEELRDTVAEGWISTREAYRNCRELVAGAKLRQMSNTDFTAAVFNQMVSMNLGETKKVGKSFKWRILR